MVLQAPACHDTESTGFLTEKTGAIFRLPACCTAEETGLHLCVSYGKHESVAHFTRGLSLQRSAPPCGAFGADSLIRTAVCQQQQLVLPPPAGDTRISRDSAGHKRQQPLVSLILFANYPFTERSDLIHEKQRDM